MSAFDRFELLPPGEILQWALMEYGRDFAIATSFQREGMVIVDMASRIGLGIRVFTLDTGRLPPETFDMIETVRARYGIDVELVAPQRDELDGMIAEHGPDLFYQGAEFRRLCCDIRKVRPLRRKLATLRAWAAGVRRDQVETRAHTPKVEEADGVIKICPLADWTAVQVSEYINVHGVPEHPLYALGYASIGCSPCTLAIAPGEDQRAGRWWWETDAKKECGIHFDPDGKVRRAS